MPHTRRFLALALLFPKPCVAEWVGGGLETLYQAACVALCFQVLALFFAATAAYSPNEERLFRSLAWGLWGLTSLITFGTLPVLAAAGGWLLAVSLLLPILVPVLLFRKKRWVAGEPEPVQENMDAGSPEGYTPERCVLVRGSDGRFSIWTKTRQLVIPADEAAREAMVDQLLRDGATVYEDSAAYDRAYPPAP